MNWIQLHVLGVFALLSILAVGGGTAVLPEMKALTVVQNAWLTPDQFRDIYSLGQLAPGPNMLMVSVIGYHVAGFLGAALAFVGFFLPCGLITLVVARIWDHFKDSPWRAAVQRGMAPVVVGLMGSGIVAIAHTAIINWTTVIFAVAVFVVLYRGKKLNPAYLILLGGAAGAVFLR